MLPLRFAPWFLLAALAVVAGSARALHPAPTGDAAGVYLSGAPGELLNFTITNAFGANMNPVGTIEFYVPADSAGILAAQGHDGGTWTASVNANGRAIVFAAPRNESLPVGANKTFRLQYLPPVVTTNTMEDWIVVSRDSLGANNTADNPVNGVDLRTFGVELLGIAAPQGALDGVVSSNQTVTFGAKVRNTASSAANDLRLRVATGVGNEVVESATFNLPAGSTAEQEVTLKLGGTLGARTVTASLVGAFGGVPRTSPLEVKRAPDLASTLSSITNTSRFLSAHPLSPLQSSVVTVHARNVGEVVASFIEVRGRLLDLDGVDRTDYFTLVPDVQHLPGIVGGNADRASFTVVPQGPAGFAPTGAYHVEVSLRFHDENNNTFLYGVQQSLNTRLADRHPRGFLVADSVLPEVAVAGTPAPSTRSFARGGPNELAFTVRASDDHLNTSRLEFLALPVDGRLPPSAAPFASDCGPRVDRGGRVACRLPVQALGEGLFTASRDFAGYELRGAFEVLARAEDEAGNPLVRALGIYTLADVQPPQVLSLGDDNRGGASPGARVTFRAEVEDAYRVGRSSGDPAGPLDAGVFLRARYDDTGEEVFPGDGLAMAYLGTAFSQNGTWSVQAAFPRFGNVTYHVYVVDADGNAAEAPVAGRLEVRSDVTPPVTTAFLEGVAGKEGWWRSAVHVRLIASDDDSGVVATFINRSGVLQQATTLLLEGDGLHELTFWSVDAAGNFEIAQPLAVSIDATAPVLTPELQGVAGLAGWFRSNVSVDLGTFDAHSGVAAAFLAVDNGTFGPPGAVIGTDGRHAVRFYGEDRAGNVGPVEELEVRIDRTAPLAALLRPANGKLYVQDMGVNLLYGGAEPIVLGPLRVEGLAEDALSGASRMVFFVDGVERAVDEVAPYTFAWSAGDEAPGPHLLRVVAYDVAGNSAAQERMVRTLPSSSAGLAALLDCDALLAERWCSQSPGMLDEERLCSTLGDVCQGLAPLPWALPVCRDVLADAVCTGFEDRVAPYAARPSQKGR